MESDSSLFSGFSEGDRLEPTSIPDGDSNKHKVHSYVTPYKVMGATDTDFFSVNLQRWDKVYIFPPHNIILKTLARILPLKGKTLLIAPLLPSQPWFPPSKSKALLCLPLLEPPVQASAGRLGLMPRKISSRLRAWILWGLVSAFRKSTLANYQYCWRSFQEFARK